MSMLGLAHLRGGRSSLWASSAGLGFIKQIGCGLLGLWLPRNEGIEKKMETIIMAYIRITIRVHSFIPS